MAAVLSFSIQHEVEKYGAYIAVASFLGLALLSILYFAQAREVRRLRDWAGRAPERDADLEARVSAQADEVRRMPAQPVRRRVEDTQVTPPPVPAATPAGNGRAGAPLSVPMGPRPAVAAAAVAAAVGAATAVAEPEAPEEGSEPGATEPAEAAAPQAVAAPAEPAEAAPSGDGDGDGDGVQAPEPEPAKAGGNGNGTGSAAAIPRATPRPAQPLRASERTATVPPRRPTAARPARPAVAPPAPPERGRRRGIVIGVIAGVVVLGLAALAITQLGGGGGGNGRILPNTTVAPPTGTTATGSTTAGGPTRAATVVVILNGTTTDGLAAKAKSSLQAAGYSSDKIPIQTARNQATPTSTVFYVPGRRRQAMSVARALQVSRVAAVDADTRSLADNSTDPPVKSDVVVILGADRTP